MSKPEIRIYLDDFGYKLGTPKSISRTVILKPNYMSSDAFYLPKMKTQTFEYKDKFIGDINRGGSCNVDIHTYCPHNLTHIETVAHLTSNGTTIKDLETNRLNGIMFVIDLSHRDQNSRLIEWNEIETCMNQIDLPITLLGIKSPYSLISAHQEFSGKSPTALHPDLTENLYSKYPNISGLILDLPSADSVDSQELLAHRNFFGITLGQDTITDQIQRFIGELAYFYEISEGYYYCTMTPPKIQTNSAILDIVLYEFNNRN